MKKYAAIVKNKKYGKIEGITLKCHLAHKLYDHVVGKSTDECLRYRLIGDMSNKMADL